MSGTLLTFHLPDPGEGLTEAEIVRWLVAPGDQVTVNQVVVEIETAKSVVELPSPFEGTVESITASEGMVVPVGDPILVVRPADTLADTPAEAPVGEPCDASAGESAGQRPDPVLVGYGPGGGPSSAEPAAPKPAAPAPAASGRDKSPAAPRPSQGQPSGRPKAKPPVRALARQLGIGLDSVTPSGPGQTVTRADVERAAESSPAAPHAAGGDRITRQPIRSVRRATAAAMTESAFTAPHASVFVDVDATRGVKFARRTGLPVLALAALALVRAAKRHPVINARWDQAAGEIVFHDYVHLGLAVASGRGLLVPCVRGADSMTLTRLAEAITETITAVRSGGAGPERMVGGTITLTNVGPLGIDGGSPILVPGQAAILAVGAIRPRPSVHKGEIKVRSVGRLTLTFDHRLIDGADAAGALGDIAAVLERPDSALT
jgi:pyruvate dehydrogenase E2 component (dihydrolipoamide acetyltransferase)